MIFPLSIGIIAVVYFLTVSNTIYGGDSGDLVSAILTAGFPHPPGYPLYTILGLLFVKLPLPLTPAGKVIIISTIAHLTSFILLFVILRSLFQKKFQPYLGCITIGVLAFNYIIWLYSIVPEVFPLNAAITLALLLFGMKFYQNPKALFLSFLAFFTGLAISHHHTFVFIIPSLGYLVYRKWKKLHNKLYSLAAASLAGLAGLIPLTYLIMVPRSYPEIIWGKSNTIAGFKALLLREGYGTFVAGPFITNVLIHRLLQIKNLVFFTLNDFSLAGFILIVIGIVMLILKRIVPHDLKVALLTGLVLFGPFFLFYANFPLSDTFNFATMERFLIVFYFLLGIPLYIGLVFATNYLTAFIRKVILHQKLVTFTRYAILLLLLILPFGLAMKNYKVISSLKNDRTAENLGEDIFINAKGKSIVLLAKDTVLFNTQYVYYSKRNDYKDKVLIHSSKLNTDYYLKTLKYHYKDLVLSEKNKPMNIEELVRANYAKFAIYSNDRYTLKDTTYEWVPYGLLFKLEKKLENNPKINIEAITSFWQQAKNNDLQNRMSTNPYIWKNFFLSDILRIYATAHQNTAFYFMSNSRIDEAAAHIKDAQALNPEDPDNNFLLSKYYQLKGDCIRAESTITSVLKKRADETYLNQLKEIGEKCYTDERDKNRIRKIVEEYLRLQSKPLKEF